MFRRPLVLKALVLAFVITFILVPWRQSRAAAGQDKKPDFGELERVVVDELKEQNTPGAVVAIIRGEQVVYVKAFGVSSVETGPRMSPEMLFRLGSTTKMFTAAALVTLAEQGKIKLDAPIANYSRGLSPKLSQVTAHQLLSNTSGLRDFQTSVISQDDSALANMVRTWKDDVFFAEPGSIYSYSSAGFWLAGFLIEELGGKPYADMMEDLLFKPAGMTRTTLRPLVALTYPLSLGHAVDEKGKLFVIRPFFNNVAMWPAGSIFSNVNDLSRFVIALMNGGRLEGKQVLAQSIVAKLPAPHTVIPGEPGAHYGYGLLTLNYRGARVVMHGGFSRGYGSMIQIAPEHHLALIVLTNKSGETLAKTRAKILELALPLGDEIEEAAKAAMPVSKGELSNYAGTYSHAPSVWQVIVKGDDLYLRHEGAESKLTRTGKHKFSFGPSGENELIFVTDKDGEARYIFTGMYSAKRVHQSK